MNFNKQRVLKLAKAVYRWQHENQTRTVIRKTGRIRFLKDTDWERGVFWSAVSTIWKATNDKEYLNGLLNYSLHTGFRVGPNARFADDIVCAQAYLDIYPQINIPEALEPTIKFVNIMINDPKPGREDWWWCDSLFMAPPVFFALAKQLNNPIYRDYANTAWWDAIDHLYDPESGLIYRDARYIPNDSGNELREANGEKVFWARGVGWVLAAVPRLFRAIPENYTEYKKYINFFRKLAAEIVKYQHTDGFWRTSLLNPNAFPAPESSATALFCYSLSWGVNNGILDRLTYLPIVEKAWTALETAVHSNGMIGWVQLPAYNPRDVKFEHNIDYGAGTFLLAASEILHLAD